MSVTRIHEDLRVTKPYTEERWRAIDALPAAPWTRNSPRATCASPWAATGFVSIDDMDGPEWNFTALSPKKRELAGALLPQRVQARFAPGAVLQFGQGQHPGEPPPAGPWPATGAPTVSPCGATRR